MIRRRPALLCLLILGLTADPSIGKEPPKRPNVLFLFADDQRADTIGALGNSRIRTPNLDRLASRGTSFTRAYCMGAMNGAVCIPSRAMLLTGRTLFHIKENMADQPTWPEAFAKAGYTTFLTGKWHNQPASAVRVFQQGRAVFFGGMGEPYKLPLQDFGTDHTLVNHRLSGEHSVKVFADEAADFLARQPADRPFLAYVAFNLPHDPRVAPAEYHARFNAEKPPLPPNFLPLHPFDNGEMTVRDEALAPWPRTPEVVRQNLADYYAAIEFLDAQVGRILEALRASGHADDTIVVYAADHGLAIGSHGLFGKQNLYEHSMRAPLILAGPGIPRDRRSDAFVYLLDIFPTLGDLAGVVGPEGSEGRSLASILRGETTSVRDSIFTAYRDVQRAVRDDRWKLIVYPRINKTQLFDLAADPAETHDLAADPDRAAEISRLTDCLRRWQETLGDHQPLTSPEPKPSEFHPPDSRMTKQARSKG